MRSSMPGSQLVRCHLSGGLYGREDDVRPSVVLDGLHSSWNGSIRLSASAPFILVRWTHLWFDSAAVHGVSGLRHPEDTWRKESGFESRRAHSRSHAAVLGCSIVVPFASGNIRRSKPMTVNLQSQDKEDPQ
ncbi:hypothetical protein RvY_01400 [Ramazzottius varieornatus]|uniref:Uncharacterized protein n=1 Tax=Ramazzottius varieornatus TaxID=947166 RepID=A0A1D1UQW8_RAMVA|nr:hypothetical protein RvY_01400 [Ramazzottius varieornatus]